MPTYSPRPCAAELSSQISGGLDYEPAVSEFHAPPTAWMLSVIEQVFKPLLAPTWSSGRPYAVSSSRTKRALAIGRA